ncbi:MAG: HD domain-containing protein, partial [Lachnospiraceae bacterium]|nr:HD domain-containing protein [Lachnospiraceae bacterium]
MGSNERFTSLRSLLGVLAKAMNLINPAVEGHHEMAAYLSYMIAKNMGFDESMLRSVIIAALMHDIGSVTIEEQQSVEELEAEAYTIAAVGADMLRELDELESIADIVEFCQCGYGIIQGALDLGQIHNKQTAALASVIHLADRATVMLDPKERVLSQVPAMKQLVSEYAGIEFDPKAVEALMDISFNEYVWFELFYNPWTVLDAAGLDIPIPLYRATGLTRVMSKIVDYRSAFTAMHSAGVAASASAIAVC